MSVSVVLLAVHIGRISPHADSRFEAAMIICQCKVVTTRCVAHALDSGASTTAQVCRQTKAGGDCGSCVLTIKAIVSQHASDLPPLDALRRVERLGRLTRR